MDIPRTLRDCMTVAPYTVRVDLPLEVARRFMEEKRIRHLPVLQDKTVVGIVSDLDIKDCRNPPPGATVALAMRPPQVVSSTAPLAEIVRDMAKRRTGTAVVVMDNGRVSGIFTLVDALLLLSRLLEPGAPARAATGS
jgi:acetoin utilization protein AcuB